MSSDPKPQTQQAGSQVKITTVKVTANYRSFTGGVEPGDRYSVRYTPVPDAEDERSYIR